MVVQEESAKVSNFMQQLRMIFPLGVTEGNVIEMHFAEIETFLLALSFSTYTEVIDTPHSPQIAKFRKFWNPQVCFLAGVRGKKLFIPYTQSFISKAAQFSKEDISHM